MSGAVMQAELASVENNAVSNANGIRFGMSVRCLDGLVGRVTGTAPDWTEQPTHLVVRTGPLVQHELALPLQWVEQVAHNDVALRVRWRQLSRVLPIVTDELLTADVREALYNSSEFREDDVFGRIEVVVRDHVVTLRGNVRTLWRALLAETIARQVRSVWKVQNELVGDDELEDAVLQTLRRDDRLRLPGLYVEVLLGDVTLRGQVRTAEEAALAVLLTRRVSGVRNINNQLVVNKTAYRAPSTLIDGHALFAERRTMKTGVG